ncbi:hypothetical protein B0J18DRAFT_473828 [Chaetomium sp. MPI-SDFR-AT-0129]|nr:hypothetical protein B0J18DRAFT_473828 [Chaetomium sp. MPI-SDFR-AT-0129]
MSPAAPTQLTPNQPVDHERRHKIRTLPFLDSENPLRELVQSNDRAGLEEALRLAKFEKDDESPNGKLLWNTSGDGLHVLLEWAVMNDAVDCMEGLLDWADRVPGPSSSTNKDNKPTSTNPNPNPNRVKAEKGEQKQNKPLIPYSPNRLYTTARTTALQTGHLSCLLHLHDCDTSSRVFGDPTELYLTLLETQARSPAVVDRLTRRLPPPPETDYRRVLVKLCGDPWVQPVVVERVLEVMLEGGRGRGRVKFDYRGYQGQSQGQHKQGGGGEPGKQQGQEEEEEEWTGTRWMAEAVGRAAECGAVSTVEVLIQKGVGVFGEVRARGAGQVEEVMREGGNPLVRVLARELPGEPTWEEAVGEWESQRERTWGGGAKVKGEGDGGVSDVHVNMRGESGRDGSGHDKKVNDNSQKNSRRIDPSLILPATTLWRRRTRHTAISMRHLVALLADAALDEFQDPASAHFARGEAERLRQDMLHHAALFFVRRVWAWLLENLPWLLVGDRLLRERLLVPVPVSVSDPDTPATDEKPTYNKPKYTFSPHCSGIAARHYLITHQIEIPLAFLEIWAMLMTETTARRALEEDGFVVHEADFRGGSESGDVLWALIMAQEGGGEDSEGEGEKRDGEEEEVVERVADKDCPAAKWAPGII